MSSEKISQLHEAALAYVRAGIAVFPCLPDSKAPAIAGAFHSATTDENLINKWWGHQPDYNLALSPHAAGWAVVDVEVDGLEGWQKELETHGDIYTYTNETPRGGRHLIFEGEIPSTVRKLFNGYAIDTRGIGGYILVPPSIVNGKPYRNLIDTELAALPAWISARVKAVEVREAPANVQLDTPGNINRAATLLKGYVEQGKVARKGAGADALTYAVAAEIVDLGISARQTKDLMLEHWYPHCEPNNKPEFVERKIANALHYKQNPGAGVNSSPSAAEAFKGVALDQLPASAQPRVERNRFDPMDDDQMDAEPEASWAVEEILPERGTVLLYGPSGSYKSFLLLDAALGLATGQPVWGVQPKVKGLVFYGALEGRSDIMRKRRPAWRAAKGITGKTDFYVMPAPLLNSSDATEFFEAIERKRAGKPVAAIFLETAAKMMLGMDATKDVPKLHAYCEGLSERFKCVVIVTHHTGNDVTQGPKDSSTYRQAFDSVIEVVKVGKLVTTAKIIKHKDHPERDEPFTFEGKPFANSLVFQITTPAEHKVLTKKEDLLEPKNVGAALKKLEAIIVDRAVSTHVLANALTPPRDNESVEEREAEIVKNAKMLVRRSANSLAAYCTKSKGSVVWHLVP